MSSVRAAGTRTAFERPAPWARADTIAATSVTIVAALLRFARLGRPSHFVFDEHIYADDGCWYAYHKRSICGVGSEFSKEHPPLGKWFASFGIRAWGVTPVGLRIGPAIAGTLTVLLVYVLARHLLGTTFGATIASSLLAVDFLHFVVSRTGHLDVFVTTFTVAAFLFCKFDLERLGRAYAPDHQARPLLDQRWRIAAGAAAGAAAASKWSGWFVLAAVAGVTLVGLFARDGGSHRETFARVARRDGPSLFIAFVAVPIALYIVTFIGVVHGSLLTWPWASGSWVRVFAARQKYMYHFHSSLDAVHPYSSAAWSWLLLKRPVAFDFVPGKNAEVLATGNPFVWWLAIPALVYVAAMIRRAGLLSAEGFVVVGFLAGYLPWVLVLRRTPSFSYYMLPAVPFMCLAMAYVAERIRSTRTGRGLIAGFAATTVALFAFYYPVLAGVPVGYDSWRSRLLFRDCGAVVQRVGGQTLPFAGEGGPPRGWCWI
jgi:dolichyl-phosphate-mannose--protein O-mannosyl transferase